jgi:Integral peroxisomal membrane peroxin
MTIFSIPYYSRLSLLPSDPSPFTIPHSSLDRSKQSPISLANYPLPDGNWRWVSKSWMIDMRSDSGEVQHDGFEYNWVFQTHKWRAEVGSLSSGGWVRRRRWVRLMMRPAKQNRKDHGDKLYSPTTPTTESGFNGLPSVDYPHSVGLPSPSVNLPDSGLSSDSLDTNDLWSRNDVELNWTICRMIMKKLGRDGRKLELWKTWLRQYHDDIGETDRKGKGKHTQWSEEDKSFLSETQSTSSELLAQLRYPPREYLIPVLRRYVCSLFTSTSALCLSDIQGDALLSSFIYPDSRAELLNDLSLAGLLSELNIGRAGRKVDFWSYSQIIT